MLQRFKYFGSSALKRARFQPMRCPNCGGSESDFLERKYLVTELRKCRSCKLLFRYPLDFTSENFQFYQQAYRQGFTSDCPNDETLQQLLSTGFVNSGRDYSPCSDVLRSIRVKPGARVIEFGASWGYGVWQLARAGYEVTGYEISRPRATYARERLGVNVVDSINEIKGGSDVFFSSHTLEHVPSIQEVIMAARKLLKKGGLFVAFTPNGSEEFRRYCPADFHRLWNRVHPNFLTDEFYKQVFQNCPLFLGSSPYNLTRLSEWDQRGRVTLPLGGIELLCVTVLS